MGKIVYNEETLLEAKESVERSNSEILEALEKIYRELDNMGQTLSTPKTSKVMPNYIDYVNKKITYVRKLKDNYNNMFNVINNEYHNYSNNVESMVGGKND